MEAAFLLQLMSVGVSLFLLSKAHVITRLLNTGELARKEVELAQTRYTILTAAGTIALVGMGLLWFLGNGPVTAFSAFVVLAFAFLRRRRLFVLEKIGSEQRVNHLGKDGHATVEDAGPDTLWPDRWRGFVLLLDVLGNLN